MTFLRRVDEEKGESRDERQCTDYRNVLDLELAQSHRVVLIEYNQEDVYSHGKSPEYIGQWEPAEVSCQYWRALLT